VAHDFVAVLFILTAGLAASGIAANLFRLIAGTRPFGSWRAFDFAIMVVAGPTVLIDHAARAWRGRELSLATFWLVSALAGYWSLAIGLFVVELALAL
jgi:hypothetical protein